MVSGEGGHLLSSSVCLHPHGGAGAGHSGAPAGLGAPSQECFSASPLLTHSSTQLPVHSFLLPASHSPPTLLPPYPPTLPCSPLLAASIRPLTVHLCPFPPGVLPFHLSIHPPGATPGVPRPGHVPQDRLPVSAWHICPCPLPKSTPWVTGKRGEERPTPRTQEAGGLVWAGAGGACPAGSVGPSQGNRG